MMPDSLKIWGTDYTGIIGFKATGQTDEPTGKNLYNPSTRTDGYYLDGSGVPTSENTCSYSDYIAVIPGENYVWSGISSKAGSNNKRAIGYNTSKSYVQVVNNVSVSGSGVSYENSFTVPSGIEYIRISFNTADSEMMVEHGTTKTNYEPYTNLATHAYFKPQGSITVTENGVVDVVAYASASIDVDRTGGHVNQEGNSIVIPSEEVDSGYSVNEIAVRAYSGNIELTTATSISTYAFANSAITGISSTSVLNGYANCFSGCTSLVSVNLPNIKTPNDGSAVSWFEGCSALTTLRLPAIDRVWNYMFKNCTSLTTLVLPALKQLARPNSLDGNTALKYIDIGGKNDGAPNSLANNWAKNCSSFDIFILRYSTLVALGNVGVFSGTPFDSGGTGGTIYIPKSLYDCLGDGTSSDYKAATNWSTVDGYGTITWAKIEGSYYETHYADGTEIPSA